MVRKNDIELEEARSYRLIEQSQDIKPRKSRNFEKKKRTQLAISSGVKVTERWTLVWTSFDILSCNRNVYSF